MISGFDHAERTVVLAELNNANDRVVVLHFSMPPFVVLSVDVTTKATITPTIKLMPFTRNTVLFAPERSCRHKWKWRAVQPEFPKPLTDNGNRCHERRFLSAIFL